ncbi:MAG: cytochrome b/b6 domain-containing protein [Methylophilaceae bacterium]
MKQSADNSNAIYVWDKWVRATHWIVASAVIFNFFSETGWIHRYVGYFAACLVIIRLFYGLPSLLRWTRAGNASQLYFPTVKDISQHISQLRSGAVTAHVGHNPLGQLAAYLLWALILSLAITGWLAGTDSYWGEDWPVDIHKALSNTLQVFVLGHFTAIALMSKLQKQNLVSAMITGRKQSPRH